MTARDIWDAMGVELNKVQAPSLLIEDYNYFINKAIQQYVNRNYNMYDMNQQMSDNLRVLKSTQFLEPIKTKIDGYTKYDTIDQSIYEVELPADYYHILNCTVLFKANKTFKNYDCGEIYRFPAARLTSDMWSQVMNNAYMRPSYRRPYFFIHNVNPVITEAGQSPKLPTNPYNGDELGLGEGTDPEITIKNGKLKLTGLARKLHTPEFNANTDCQEGVKNLDDQVNKYAGYRYGNASKVRMELRFGRDDVFTPILVSIDYLKTPQYIRLTQKQIETTEDTSQIMEFPDYVCQEIINGLVTLVMENASDPRLATNPQINQTIAMPGQQQQQSK